MRDRDLPDRPEARTVQEQRGEGQEEAGDPLGAVGGAAE